MAFTDFLTDCRMMDKRTIADGYGGVTVELVPGAEFRAAIVMDSTTEAQIAQQNGLKTIYKILTGELVSLTQGDIVQRMEDGLTLRVTSNARDMSTPKVAQAKFRQVNAEAVTP